MSYINSLIQSDPSYIYSSKSETLKKIDEYNFHSGDQVRFDYYIGSELSTIIAIGIKDGKGSGCYKLLIPFNQIYVSGIVYEFPGDDGTYIYVDENNDSFLVENQRSTKITTKMTVKLISDDSDIIIIPGRKPFDIVSELLELEEALGKRDDNVKFEIKDKILKLL